MARRFIYWHSLLVVFLILAAIIVVSALLITSHQALVEAGRITFSSVWHG